MSESKFLRRAGRPRNPYSKRLGDFAPKATCDWLQPSADLAASNPLPGKFQGLRKTEYDVIGLLMQMEVPVLRRVIESILTHDHGDYPASVTTALANVTTQKRYTSRWPITLTELPYPPRGRRTHVYTYKREPTGAEIRALVKMCRDRDKYLNKNVLKRAGERFVREWLVRGGYTQVTPDDRVGKVRIGGRGLTTDLVAYCERESEWYAISVKNQREWLSASVGRTFDDVLKRAHHFDARAWLVVPFALDTAIERSRTSRIRLTLMGKQIAPVTAPGKLLKLGIENMRPALGVEQYGFIMERADRTDAAEFDTIKTHEPLSW
jgi:hypothetical protein